MLYYIILYYITLYSAIFWKAGQPYSDGVDELHGMARMGIRGFGTGIRNARSESARRPSVFRRKPRCIGSVVGDCPAFEEKWLVDMPARSVVVAARTGAREGTAGRAIVMRILLLSTHDPNRRNHHRHLLLKSLRCQTQVYKATHVVSVTVLG